MPLAEDIPPHEQYVIDVLLNCASGSSASLPKDHAVSTPTPFGIRPCPRGEKGEPLVVPVLLSTIEKLAHLRIYLPKDIRSLASRETVYKSVQEVKSRFPDGIPLLDPVANQKITDDKFLNLVNVRSTQSAYAVY